MKQDPHVDHFIPWSRYPRDLVQNFVLAHNACNLDKGDMLGARRFKSLLSSLNLSNE